MRARRKKQSIGKIANNRGQWLTFERVKPRELRSTLVERAAGGAGLGAEEAELAIKVAGPTIEADSTLSPAVSTSSPAVSMPSPATFTTSPACYLTNSATSTMSPTVSMVTLAGWIKRISQLTPTDLCYSCNAAKEKLKTMPKLVATAVDHRAPLFEANWTLANEETQAADSTDFTLNDGTTRADFVAMIGELKTLIAKVDADSADLTLLMAKRNSLRTSTRQTMSDWRKKADSDVGGTPYGAGLPTLPSETEALDSFLKTLRVANDRWIQINGAGSEVPHFTPPMIVKGTTQAQFEDAIDLLEATGKELETAETALPGERAKRDNKADAVYQTETAYRKKVIADFSDNSPALETLPTLQPASHGYTPQAVELSGVYNAATGEGDLSWTASPDPNLAHYELRISAGPKYKEADSSLLATLQAGVLSYAIAAQYLQPGAVISSVVKVVLDDDHEKQSNTVTLTAPL